ncbi:MAG: aminotransferase class III-fold pyridoxal phosphate-dependent enzyme [Pseudomonadota bacterium]
MEIVSAEGAYLKTANGQQILDASAGAAVGNIGWGRQEVAEAAAESLSRLTYALPPFATPERLELAERLRTDWLPGEMRGISFFGSGSEANEAAMRLARQYQLAMGRKNRWKIIGRDVSYNGTTLATLAVGGHDARRKGFGPMMREMPHAPACYCLRCPLGKAYPSCEVACATALEAIIEREGADTIAAFHAEPITGTSGGGLVPPDEYLPTIARICREHDILLIADEVLTGFGRTGKRMAVDHWSIEPDIIVLGKGMSGGYAAMSAVATQGHIPEAMQAAGIAPMFHTYGGHPSQCAAANKTLEIMKTEGLVERVAQLGPTLDSKLEVLQQNPFVADVRGRGFLYGIEVVKDKETLEMFPMHAGVTFKIMEATVKRGVFTYFGGTGTVRDVVCIAPPFILEESDMDTIVTALNEAITEACTS